MTREQHAARTVAVILPEYNNFSIKFSLRCENGLESASPRNNYHLKIGEREMALHIELSHPIGECQRRRKADMKRARFSEDQFIGVLKEIEAGALVSDL
jgi:hypothetical protein